MESTDCCAKRGVFMKNTWLMNFRKKYSMSQNTVAQKAGISPQYYNFIENNRRRPSPDVAKRIATVLGFPDDWYRLLEREHEAKAQATV